LRLFLRLCECARIHLHIPLRAADTHTYPYGYDNFDSITNADTDRYPNVQWDSHVNTSRNAKTHTNSEIPSNAALSTDAITTPLAYL
jgi:hypothetical protein